MLKSFFVTHRSGDVSTTAEAHLTDLVLADIPPTKPLFYLLSEVESDKVLATRNLMNHLIRSKSFSLDRLLNDFKISSSVEIYCMQHRTYL